MCSLVVESIKRRNTCNSMKEPRKTLYGKLRCIPNQRLPFKDLSVDVVCGFPESCNVSNVAVVTDLFSKLVFFFDCVLVPSSKLIFELMRVRFFCVSVILI
jgi:hypothetical protein